MSIAELIEMMNRRLVYLSQLRTSAISLGDVDQADKVDAEIASTQETLNKLLSIPA